MPTTKTFHAKEDLFDNVCGFASEGRLVDIAQKPKLEFVPTQESEVRHEHEPTLSPRETNNLKPVDISAFLTPRLAESQLKNVSKSEAPHSTKRPNFRSHPQTALVFRPMAAQLDKTVHKRYLELPQKGRSQVMYVWISGNGMDLRCKTQTMTHAPANIAEVPIWSFDGSSTGHCEGKDSDIYLFPCKMFCDPFRPGGNNKMVLCETFYKTREPTTTNFRKAFKDSADLAAEFHPWFGIEQEFVILGRDGRPMGWPKGGYPAPQGAYYCGVGSDKAFGRDVVEAAYRACIYAGIQVAGCNAEVMPGQWEFQIGPCEGTEIGDQLWMTRFILQRVAEDFGLGISFDPKFIPGDWSGSGCHINFSTKATRAENGVDLIKEMIDKLEKKHMKHLEGYDANGGEDNKRRLTGKYETAPYNQFSWGVGNRTASIRINSQVAEANKGYFEDRRPAANCDPYRACDLLLRTCLLDKEEAPESFGNQGYNTSRTAVSEATKQAEAIAAGEGSIKNASPTAPGDSEKRSIDGAERPASRGSKQSGSRRMSTGKKSGASQSGNTGSGPSATRTDK